MPQIKDLPLEEKLNLSVSELPFSEEVKEELQKKGVYKLQQIIDKLNRGPERLHLPGYTKRVWEEAGYLAVEMGFIPPKYEEEPIYESISTNSNTYEIKNLERHIAGLQEVLDREKKIHERHTQIKERIDNYVNKEA